MKTPTEYWIWMQTALGAGARVSGLLRYYKTPEQIYNALCLKELDSLIEPAMRRRLSAVSPSQSYRIQKICTDNGWYMVTPDSHFYPDTFRMLDNMPLVLYVNGDPALLTEKIAISFVGTRHASVYGKRVAEQLSFSVAAAGAVVVSGCALGIDSCSHLGALEADGKTVGFLGSPLDCDYPKENRSLREAIARNGALVSEYAPGSAVTRVNFPIRNRLIAAASLGTVVVEANQKSGALITANYAMEYGRDVFAVPGEITDSAFIGGNSLIRDGAKPVFNAMDILEEYAYDYGAGLDLKKTELPIRQNLHGAAVAEEQNNGMTAKTVISHGEKKKTEEKKTAPVADRAVLPDYIDQSGKKIYDFIVKNQNAEADEISSALGFSAAETLSALTMLELAGCIKKGSGNNYDPI